LEQAKRRGAVPRGVFTQHYESDALDASLLLLPLFHFLPPDDPRIRATVSAVAEELSVDGLLMRYRVEDVHDSLPGVEGTFTGLFVLVGLRISADR
jgi:alpha,alpha-trehalase